MKHNNIFIFTVPCTTAIQATDCGVGKGGVRLSAGVTDYCFLRNVQACSGPETSSYSRGTRRSLQGVKRPMRETEQLPTSRSKVQKVHGIIPTPTYLPLHGAVHNWVQKQSDLVYTCYIIGPSDRPSFSRPSNSTGCRRVLSVCRGYLPKKFCRIYVRRICMGECWLWHFM